MQRHQFTMAKPANISAIWDNGGKSLDRFTIAVEPDADVSRSSCLPTLSLSLDAASPQGFSQWAEAVPGPHLGRDITWEELPEHIRAHVTARMKQPE